MARFWTEEGESRILGKTKLSPSRKRRKIQFGGNFAIPLLCAANNHATTLHCMRQFTGDGQSLASLLKKRHTLPQNLNCHPRVGDPAGFKQGTYVPRSPYVNSLCVNS
jgi:hypothetical protein